MPINPTPAGYHSLTPYLTVKNAAEAIEWYKKVFLAEEAMRMPGPDGGVMHAEIRIGDSILMLGDENPQYGNKSPQTLGGTASGVLIYVDKVDEWFARATAAGATVDMPPMDMFWGDRYSKVVDPFGHGWSIATHVEDVQPEEMQKRSEAWMKGQAA